MAHLPYTLRRPSGVYVLRRIFRLRNGNVYPITLSLQTKERSVARQRAAAACAALENEVAAMEYQIITHGGVRPATTTAELRKAALDAMLPAAARDHFESDDANIAAQTNLVFADFFDNVRRNGGRAVLSAADCQRLVDQGRDEMHMKRLALLTRANANCSVISDVIVEHEVTDLGFAFDQSRVAGDRDTLLACAAEAQRLAARLIEPAVRNQPEPLLYLLAAACSGDKTLPSPVNCLDVASPQSNTGYATDPIKFSTQLIETSSQIIEAGCKALVARGNWKPGIAKDAERVVKELCWILGDVDIRSLTQSQAAAWDVKKRLMPKNVRVQALWSKPYDEVKKGFAALTLANTRKNKTHCKDLAYLATFQGAMITAGVWEKGRIDFNGLKSKIPTADKTGQRPPWSQSDIETILSSPIHTGNDGSKRRLVGGSHIYHDAGYWAVPGAALSALRQNEFLGLLTDEVIDDHAIPHLIIQPNYLRELKNESSERVIPLHPRLIDLGFLDYVKRMRHEGHGIVFPELWVNAVKCGGDQYRSISWDKLIDWLRLQPGFIIPVGTAPIGNAGKEADFHSIRTTALTYLDRLLINQNIVMDIAGHARKGVTARSYQNLIAAGELDMVLRDRLSVLTMLPDFTANVAHAPLNILPIKLRTR